MRRQLAQLAAELRKGGWQACDSPDHPYLIMGPDLICGRDGRLAALFVSPHGRASAGLLVARLTCTRLALPTHTAMLVWSPDRVDDDVHQFDAALDTLDLRGLLAALDSARPLASTSALVEAQHAAFKRAALVSRLVEEDAEQVEGTPTSQRVPPVPGEIVRATGEYPLSILLPSPETGWWSLPRSLWDATLIEDALVSRLAPGRPAMTKSTIRRLVPSALRLQFLIDRGVPYRRDESHPLILVGKRSREAIFDPGQTVRASALVGIGVLDPTVTTEKLREAAGILKN